MFSLLPLFLKADMEMSLGLQSGPFKMGNIQLERENKKARECGVLPPAHEVPSLQFEIESVFTLQVKQNAVTCCLSGHILITGKCRYYWVFIMHQIDLMTWKHKM